MTRLLSLIAFALLIASPVLSQSIESELVERIRTLAMEFDDAGRADDYRAIEAVALALARARHGDGSLDAELLNLADDFDLIGNTDTAEVLRAIAPLTEPPPPDGNDCTDPEHAGHDHCVTDDPPPTPPNELQAVISGSQVAGIQNTLATQGYLPLPYGTAFWCQESLGPVVSCDWNWGDGWPITSGGWFGQDAARHEYVTRAYPIGHMLTLKVIDADGNSAFASLEIKFICYYGPCDEPGYVYPTPP